MNIKPKLRVNIVVILLCICFVGCSVAGYDSTNPKANSLAISAVVDEVNSDLTTQNCSAALAAVQPLFNSSNSINSVRLAMASTYGCYSKINVFTVMSDLVNFGGDLGASGFWEFMAKEFASTSTPVDDKIPQAAEAGTDAIMSVLNPGTFLIAADTINATTNNPGSILAADRTNDANAYLTFMSMALIGSLESRNANPISGTFHKSNSLPWTSAALMSGDGCAFASAVLNFFDGLQYIISAAPSAVAAKFSATSVISLSLAQACNFGCNVCSGSNCTGSICPITLRSRSSCTGTVTDQNSCAAAAIISFVNLVWTTGPP